MKNVYVLTIDSMPFRVYESPMAAQKEHDRILSVVRDYPAVFSSRSIAVKAFPLYEGDGGACELWLEGFQPDWSKIGAIKEVRAQTGLGLKEAKDLVEADRPVLIHSYPNEVAAGYAAADFEKTGAVVSIRPSKAAL